MAVDPKTELVAFIERQAEAGSLSALDMTHMTGVFLSFLKDPEVSSEASQRILRSALHDLLDDPSLALHRGLVASTLR